MSLQFNLNATHQKPPLTPNRNLAIHHRRAFQARECRLSRRPRLRTNRNLVIRSQSGPSPFENLFQSLLSQFPSVNSLELITPALGFASGVALYLSRFNSNRDSRVSDVAEWILFISPTPFNRFVMLRCPSVSFEGSEMLENANEKLVREEKHFVRLNTGRIHVRDSDEIDDDAVEEKLVYQRVCVSTDDGGVISLDWPANLDLREERGLDTTVLLIPGTAEGSMDKRIRSFVCDSLMRGYFPVVVNPRGCAGSPLTTARLFTAADSDDICTAVQFISRARPWTTLMGVGWGYGANMLTKYLAEVGERTPLTAATCIDNPFDLEEATRPSPSQIVLDQKLTDGLKSILRSNKELFRGRTKEFDVEKALLAKSVRDFDKAISTVSFGFDAIEDFYATSSTIGVIGNVKIPVLFIQNDHGMVPLYSIPRSLIAANPFTSLLLCSCLPSKIIANGRYATYWCQHLTIEWLAAVELGLLKGRHPLLEDVDITLNPAKGLTLVEGRPSDKSGRVNKSLNLSQSSVLNGYAVYPIEEAREESDTSVIIGSKIRPIPQKISESKDISLEQESNGQFDQTSSLNAEIVNEEISPTDNETGQVLQTAEVVLNMLDVTMPDTLTQEQKKKVLTAVGQGETLMNALQVAVPEDVRGKLTAAVAGIFQNQGKNLKLDGLLNIGPIPNVAPGLKTKIQEKVGGLSSARGYEDPRSLDPRDRVNDMGDNSNDNQVSMDKLAGGLKLEREASDTLQKAIDSGCFQSTTHEVEVSSAVKEDTTEWKISHKDADISKERDAESFDCAGTAGGTEDLTVDPQKVDQNGDTYPSSDQNTTTSSTEAEDGLSPPVSSSMAQAMEMEGSDNLKGEEKSLHFVSNENNSDSMTFSVSEAFDALTGMDDSTQVAVNSVFGLIEDMITQLEEEKDTETDVNDGKEVENSRTSTVSQDHRITKDYNSVRKEENKDDLSSQSDMVDDLSSNDGMNLHHGVRTKWAEEEIPIRNSDPFKGNSIISSCGNDKVSHITGEDKMKEHLINSKLLAGQSNKVRHLYNAPLFITTSPYSDSVYKEYLRKYLLARMPNTKSLDLDTTTALFLDYFPEEGQWKLLELPRNNEGSAGDVDEVANKDIQANSPSKSCEDKVIEPQYIIMDAEKEQEPVQEYDRVESTNQKVVMTNKTSKELMGFVKAVILESLKVEVDRRLIAADTKEMEPNLAGDLEDVANAVSLAAGYLKDHKMLLVSKDGHSGKLGTLNGEHITRAILSAVQETSYLRRVLPVGVVVGTSLAALRKFFNVATINGSDKSEAMTLDQINQYVERNRFQFETEANLIFPYKMDRKFDVSRSRDGEEAESKELNKGKVMVGAVTAALGASALLVHQQDSEKGNETSKTLSKSSEEKGNHLQEPEKLEDEISEKSKNNIVTSLAEKAMSVAGPVVPTKEDGEVDQDRLVAMLAELGQKGGVLKLVGKVALLWGGLRGAISLTDRLILFLQLAERPLLHRILGFVCMVLVLWSPVVVPLLPTLVRSWAMHNSNRTAELACIVGLYASITILVMLWGKRIRGYESPFKQYGMDITSLSKIQNFLIGLVGGFMLVISIHSLNVLLGSVRLSWSPTFTSYSSDAVTWLKVYGKMLLLVGQGIITATGVALVEELLFRSWLQDEIATDLGYHRGVIFSGLAFSLLQRSPWAIPGLWLLSLGLAGARQRSQGSLSIPIGLRSGIMASSFFLEKCGFLTYQPNFSVWKTGTHPFQPFSGVAGLVFALLLAVVLYPRQPLLQQKKMREIRD